MPTGQDICTRALLTIGELGQGQDPSPEDLDFCLNELNEMTSSLQADGAFIYSRTVTPYAWAAGTASNQIGTGSGSTAPFNVARPIRIDAARILMTINNALVGVKNLTIISWDKFVEHADKTSTSNIPEELYCDYAFPNANLFLFDIPAVSCSLELTAWVPLQQFTLTGQFAMPPEYLDPIVKGLAVKIGPGFSKPPDSVTVAMAAQGADRIKRLNFQNLFPGVPMPPSTPQQAPQGNG